MGTVETYFDVDLFIWAYFFFRFAVDFIFVLTFSRVDTFFAPWSAGGFERRACCKTPEGR